MAKQIIVATSACSERRPEARSVGAFEGLLPILHRPVEGLRQKLGNGISQVVVTWPNDNFDCWKVIKEDLSAPPTWRHDPPVPITYGNNSLQFVVALRCGTPDDHQLGARSSSEVMGIHGSDNLSTDTSGGTGDRVVVSTAAGLRHTGGRLDEFKVNVVLLRGHQAMIPQLALDCVKSRWVSQYAGFVPRTSPTGRRSPDSD